MLLITLDLLYRNHPIIIQNEVIYHLWENESVFILIEEYKSKNFPQKPMITNISKTEVENLFMQKLHFKGLGDENAIFLN